MALILPELNGSKGIWGSILNDALNGLDQRVISNTDRSTGNTQAIALLDQRVTTNTTNITTNAGDIADHETRITTNTNNIATNTGDITGLETQVATNTNNIADHETRLDAIEGAPVTPTITIASDADGADQTFNSVPFIAGNPEVGVVFTAPPSGTVLILFGARAQTNSVNTRVHVSVAVYTGSTIGSGTVIAAASDQCAIETGQPTTADSAGDTSRLQASRHRVITGLTPGATYNTRTEHKTSIPGSGTVYFRNIDVIPL